MPQTKITTCGIEIAVGAKAAKHYKQCEVCRPKNSLGVGAIAKRGGHQARCGAIFRIKRELREHFKKCGECDRVKALNIAERMRKINESAEINEKISIAAKKVARRPDLLEIRSRNLAKWRSDRPEEFENHLQKIHKIRNRSTMEKYIRKEMCDWPDGRIWIGNTRKQVDFVKPFGSACWLEVDGFYHFFSHQKQRPRANTPNLQYVQERDRLLKEEALRRNVCLIRVSYDCFRYSARKDHGCKIMRDEWKVVLEKLLKKQPKGVWCLGRSYEHVPWASKGCTILRSPTEITTLPSQMG